MRQTKGIARIHQRTTSKRVHLPLKKPVCGAILFHKKERWQITTGTRLPAIKRMDQ